MRIADMQELLEGYKREGIDPTPYYWYAPCSSYLPYLNNRLFMKTGLPISASTVPASMVATVSESRFVHFVTTFSSSELTLTSHQRLLAWLTDRFTVR